MSFEDGIIRTGNALTSIQPDKGRVLKMVPENRIDFSTAESIERVNSANREIEVQPFEVVKEVDGYCLVEDRFIEGRKFRPRSRNIGELMEAAYRFSEQLEEKGVEVYFPNFNYGNIIRADDGLHLIGMKRYREESPMFNYLAMCESLYEYFDGGGKGKRILRDVEEQMSGRNDLVSAYRDSEPLLRNEEFREKLGSLDL